MLISELGEILDPVLACEESITLALFILLYVQFGTCICEQSRRRYLVVEATITIEVVKIPYRQSQNCSKLCLLVCFCSVFQSEI